MKIRFYEGCGINKFISPGLRTVEDSPTQARGSKIHNPISKDIVRIVINGSGKPLEDVTKTVNICEQFIYILQNLKEITDISRKYKLLRGQ